VKRTLTLLTAVLLAGALLAGVAAPAGALPTPENGICEDQEDCFYPLGNFVGSVSDLGGISENHSAERFYGPGFGKGHVLNDWARSFRSRSWYLTTKICMHSWFRGPCISVGAGYSLSSLGSLNDQQSSHNTLF
jgi:hypothetical protein